VQQEDAYRDSSPGPISPSDAGLPFRRGVAQVEDRLRQQRPGTQREEGRADGYVVVVSRCVRVAKDDHGLRGPVRDFECGKNTGQDTCASTCIWCGAGKV